MKKVKGFAKEFGVSIMSLALPLLASAAPAPAKPAGTGFNAAASVPNSGITLVQNVLDLTCAVFAWAFYLLIALAVIFIVIAAFRYLTSGGDPEKVKGATNTILYATIAVGVALLARAIPSIVIDFLVGGGGVTFIGAC